MHDGFDIAQEQMNKKQLLGSKPFLQKLATILKHHADRGIKGPFQSFDHRGT